MKKAVAIFVFFLCGIPLGFYGCSKAEKVQEKVNQVGEEVFVKEYVDDEVAELEKDISEEMKKMEVEDKLVDEEFLKNVTPEELEEVAEDLMI
jgi:hypothetical protein